jgi:hypothetical protein
VQHGAESGSGISASTLRRTRAQFPTAPLCMNIQRPHANGWQFGRVVGVAVAARTWAKNRCERM